MKWRQCLRSLVRCVVCCRNGRGSTNCRRHLSPKAERHKLTCCDPAYRPRHWHFVVRKLVIMSLRAGAKFHWECGNCVFLENETQTTDSQERTSKAISIWSAHSSFYDHIKYRCEYPNHQFWSAVEFSSHDGQNLRRNMKRFSSNIMSILL